MNWFEQALSDIGDAVVDVVDFVADVVEDVADVVEAVVEGTGEVIAAVGDAITGQGDLDDVGDAFEDAAQGVGDAVVAGATELAQDVNELGNDAMNALDTFVFDPVDYLSGGVIDVDYDNGQFSAGLDVGIASVGVSFGRQGFSADAGFDLGIASGEISYDPSGGFAASGSIGVNWGPLPYAEGHINVSPEGDISIGGHLQGTLPLPGGSIGGEVDGGFYRNADGSWGASSSLDVELSGPGGMGASLSADTSLDGGPGGISFDTGLDASVTGPGGTGASFSTDTSLDVGRGGVSFDTGLDASVTGPGGTGASFSTDTSLDVGRGGVSFDTGLDVSATGPGGTHAGLSTDAGFTAGVDADGNLVSEADASLDVDVNGRQLHASGTVSQTGHEPPVITDDISLSMPTTANPAASAMSALAGTGSLSDALSGEGTRAGDDAAALFSDAGLDPSQLIEEAGDLVESGAFDDFTSDIVGSEIVEAVADQVWDDIGQ